MNLPDAMHECLMWTVFGNQPTHPQVERVHHFLDGLRGESTFGFMTSQGSHGTTKSHQFFGTSSTSKESRSTQKTVNLTSLVHRTSS